MTALPALPLRPGRARPLPLALALAAGFALSAVLSGCARTTAPAPAAQTGGTALLSRSFAPPFPPRPLVSQDGEEVLLAPLFEEHVVVLVFGYVRCTDTCPLTTANLRRVQALLDERLGDDVLLVTVTLDPEHDTPAVLKRHAEESGARPGWLFLTGAPAEVDGLRAALGFVGRGVEAGSDRSDHSALALVGSSALGRFMHLPALGSPRDLAAAALRLADAAAARRAARGPPGRPGG